MTTMVSSRKFRDSGTHRRDNSHNNSVFREAQTDLLNPFQGHHFDLLGGNPPPRNPDFVANSSHLNPPAHNPDFVPTTTTRRRNSSNSNINSNSSSLRDNLPLTRSELSVLAGSFSASPAVRRVSHNNPFEETTATTTTTTTSSNPFEETTPSRAVGSSRAPLPRATQVVQNHNSLSSSSSSSSGIPVASVVAISEDEEGSAIPFVAAMRIDEEEEQQQPCSSTSARSSTFHHHHQQQQHISSPGPAIRGAHPQEPRRERPPPLVFHSATSTQDPEWLGRQRSTQNSNNSFAGPIRRNSSSSSSYTNWSRISVQAKATVKEAKRSLKKAIGREAKKLKKTIGKETKVLRRAIREDLDRMGRVRHSCGGCHR